MNRSITISLMDDELAYIKYAIASKPILNQYEKNIIKKLDRIINGK